jgi:uncharacterized protein (DUF2164 family)
MKEKRINPLVAEAISHLDEFQQLKLLEFINALTGPNHKNKILSHAGTIEPSELQRMEEAIKDCEKIDGNEW